METQKLGPVPVIPAPFRNDESLDFDALEHLIEFAARSGVKAACLPAYGTEFYKMTEGEREEVVKRAVAFARGRLTIMGQSNHGSAHCASEVARRNEAVGAGIVSFALPRQFAYSENDLLRYAIRVASSVSCPVLVQDFNPGGVGVGASFAVRLAEAAPQFRYLKLEEPSMAPKAAAIHEGTKDHVSVLEGWGGMYLLELWPAGIGGVMPGLALIDRFQEIWKQASAGNLDEARRIHARILPQIVYALQSMELFHHCEKRLLRHRGFLDSAVVREPAVTLDAAAEAYIDQLNRFALG
jgi:4-hydroxy-tetrahydrodipicolinate synthase